MLDDGIPAPSDPYYTADEIILYGVELNKNKDKIAHLAVGLIATELQIKLASKVKINGSIVLAYGYAFEGHCYRLDKQRIFIVTSADAEEAVGCGFDKTYSMWRITAAEQILEIATNFADARTLILDSQLPGKRSPSSYAITLRMGHRNGRLSND